MRTLDRPVEDNQLFDSARAALAGWKERSGFFRDALRTLCGNVITELPMPKPISINRSAARGFRPVALTLLLLSAAGPGQLLASDQSTAGAGNPRAIEISRRSPLIQSAHAFLVKETNKIRDAKVRKATRDAVSNPSTCVAHRAGLAPNDKKGVIARLLQAGLLDPDDQSRFPGGFDTGVFPPLNDDGSACPKLTQRFESAPGRE